MRPTVLLFDVDGTLVTTGGVGRRALEMAFERSFGRRDACRSFRLDGMTDRAIVRTGMGAIGVEPTDAIIDQVLVDYLAGARGRGGRRARRDLPGARRHGRDRRRRARCAPGDRRGAGHRQHPRGCADQARAGRHLRPVRLRRLRVRRRGPHRRSSAGAPSAARRCSARRSRSAGWWSSATRPRTSPPRRPSVPSAWASAPGASRPSSCVGRRRDARLREPRRLPEAMEAVLGALR